MAAWPGRALDWWDGLDDEERRRSSALGLIASLALLHYLCFTIAQPFYIEDAGISFAYARNLASGEGLVSYPGGERVEGYSNALWVFLLALLQLLGLNPWVGSKLLGALFIALSLPLAWGLAARALLGGGPWRPGQRESWALLAPLLLALSPQIAIWNASGLENSLFGLLLLGGAWRTCVEAEAEAQGQRPAHLAALLFFLLSMTRPEALMYAAIGLLGRLAAAARARSLRGLLGPLLAFLLPWLLYNAWRYAWFGWPYPNTYYGKLGAGTTFQPFAWDSRGWKQITDYFRSSQLVWALPLLPLAMSAGAGRLRALGPLLIVLLAPLLLWDGRAGLHHLPAALHGLGEHWVKARVIGLLVSALLLGLLGLGRPGWLARGQLWAFASAGIFFIVYSGNDWMKAFRWFNLVGFSLLPLIAVGMVRLLSDSGLLDRQIRGQPAGLLLLVPLLLAHAGVQARNSADFIAAPETSVRDIGRRVEYMKQVQRDLDLDQVTLLDVDMGAHMVFTDWRILDIAGLIEIPMARHRRFDRPFIQQYLFQEERPHFAHVHGNWARSSRIDTHSEWKQGYVEIPGYPIGGTSLHIGNHVRRDLLATVGQRVPGEPLVIFEGGLRLVQLDLPVPQVAEGGALYLPMVFQAPMSREPFQILLYFFDERGVVASTMLEPGQGYLPVKDWRREEQVHSRFRVLLPPALTPGRYQLGLALIDEKRGTVRRLLSVDGQPPGEEKVLLEGEYRPAGKVVEVLLPADARERAEHGRVEALALAEGGDCAGAWARFKDASRVILADLGWREEHEPAIRRALSLCELRAAQAADDEEDRRAALLRARAWDHRAPGLARLLEPEAQGLVVEGARWMEADDAERAYRAWALALRLDPSLSHVRRRAEQARDRMLGIDR